MVISSGTIIHRKSVTTAGAISARGNSRFMTALVPRGTPARARRPARRRPTSVLLVVAALAHLAVGRGLRRLERLLDARAARQRRAHLLAHRDADRLELGDRCELNADVRALGQRAVVWVGAVDRLLLGLGEARRLQEIGVGVGALARAGGHGGPAFLLADEVDVVLARRPGDEGLRRAGVLGARRDRERPGPQPVGALGRRAVRSLRERHLVGDLALLG